MSLCLIWHFQCVSFIVLAVSKKKMPGSFFLGAASFKRRKENKMATIFEEASRASCEGLENGEKK